MKKLVVTIALVASMSAATAEHPFLKNVSQLFATEQNLAIVRHPDSIDACLLRRVKIDPKKNDFNFRFEELAVVKVTPLQVASAQSALVLESSYGWDYSSACLPDYYARLHFHRGADVVAIDFCFECRILRVMRNGVEVNQKEFVAPEFLSAFKAIFPRDHGLAGVN